MNTHSMRITYENGASQIINPSDKFDGNYHDLAHTIAGNCKFTYKILKEPTKTTRKR